MRHKLTNYITCKCRADLTASPHDTSRPFEARELTTAKSNKSIKCKKKKKNDAIFQHTFPGHQVFYSF